MFLKVMCEGGRAPCREAYISGCTFCATLLKNDKWLKNWMRLFFQQANPFGFRFEAVRMFILAMFMAAVGLIFTNGAAFAQPIGPELIVNGGFEADTYNGTNSQNATGWTRLGATGGMHRNTGRAGPGGVGNYFPLGGWYNGAPDGSIFQNVALDVGASYVLSFYHGTTKWGNTALAASGEVKIGSQPARVTALINGNKATTVYSFTATEANTRIEFTIKNGSATVDWDLDNISLRRLAAPEIEIQSSVGGAIADGGIDVQGIQTAGTPASVRYTVTNTGSAPLTLDGTPSASNLVNIAAPVMVSAPVVASLAPSESTTFDVTYIPNNGAVFSFDLDVLSDDADESPYDIEINGAGNERPTVVLTGPFAALEKTVTVTATFSEAITGLTLADFVVGNGTASSLTIKSPRVATFQVTPRAQGLNVTVSLPANSVVDAIGVGNSVSNTLKIAGGALTEEQRDEVSDIITDGATRALRSELQAHQRANREARERLGAIRRCRALNTPSGLSQDELEQLEANCRVNTVSRNAPLSFAGTLNANQDRANMVGRFSSQSSSAQGRRHRIFSGDFDMSRYSGGDVTASLSARYAWERVSATDVLWGSFVGVNASQTQIARSFRGTRVSYGLSAGAYFVDALSDHLFWDGFAAVSLGRNNLKISDDDVSIGSDYSSRSIQMGGSLSGFKEFEGFELRPELSLSLGYTQIGRVGLDVSTPTGSATEILDASSVSLARLSFAPEFLFPTAVPSPLYDRSAVRVTPSITCEYLKAKATRNQCGGGLALEWNASARDALHEVSISLSKEVIGGISRESFGLKFESNF